MKTPHVAIHTINKHAYLFHYTDLKLIDLCVGDGFNADYVTLSEKEAGQLANKLQEILCQTQKEAVAPAWPRLESRPNCGQTLNLPVTRPTKAEAKC